MNARWLAQVAASAAVRRVVYLAIAALLGLLATCGRAEAANECPNTSVGCTREEAYNYAWEAYEAVNLPCKSPGELEHVPNDPPATSGMYRVKYWWTNQACDSGFRTDAATEFYVYSGCPVGTDWHEQTHTCRVNNCGSAPPFGGAASKSFYMCSGGCRYEQDSAGGVSACLGMGASMTCFADRWSPTGDFCEAADKPPMAFDSNMETCRSVGPTATYQECVKPNGDHCVTSAKGAVLCWAEGQEGERITTDGQMGGDRKQAPATNEPPSNMQDPSVVDTTQTSVGGTVYNTTIYSGTGNTGGQGNVGAGGKNTGGTGDPQGDGTGGGNGEGDGDEDGPGDPAGHGGALYESNGRTVGDVFGEFKGRIQNAPIATAGTAFLTTTVSAACPVFTVEATDYWDTLTFDYHCSGPLNEALLYGAWIILAVAAFAAFKVAFY